MVSMVVVNASCEAVVTATSVNVDSIAALVVTIVAFIAAISMSTRPNALTVLEVELAIESVSVSIESSFNDMAVLVLEITPSTLTMVDVLVLI